MSTNLFPHVYERLIKENTDWLLDATKHIENSLEREHIISIMNHSAKEYRERGYEEAMSERADGKGGKP
ncbi:hypothetical protein OYT1_ch1623 [Ferriphaselus amnicola]|uniref:Uncharacterized protein n=1 Tax=Ferriphaselus amnicola TaxID=1188319 RepID=A0A2Z6GCJ8_9PROT|nr:hypothetical protein [Ferriphaselus amnicola]BBE51170.1 hypothetical protein OYT1_ch1623 [Ferriphaselus amnicola]